MGRAPLEPCIETSEVWQVVLFLRDRIFVRSLVPSQVHHASSPTRPINRLVQAPFLAASPSPFYPSPPTQRTSDAAVPPDTVPVSAFIPIHDLERGNRSLMPVLDFAENILDAVGH